VRGEGLSENGEFWGDAIRRLKDNAQERLNMAKRHLPLPGAFWQAAIALRDSTKAAIQRSAQRHGLKHELIHGHFAPTLISSSLLGDGILLNQVLLDSRMRKA
jgi:hypothetical protein